MTVTVCDGCGRRAGDGEHTCAACGRVLDGGATVSPPGWMTTTLAAAPAAVDESLAATAEERNTELFTPTATHRRRRAAASGEAALPTDDDAPRRIADLPGGAGWRVRLSAAQAALADSEARRVEDRRLPDTLSQPGIRQLPGWVLPALVAAILLTSLAALALVLLHVISGR